ncbi:MAG: DUF3794 domain-containing protein [Epulopiscium sp.]|nr:DUF3794 domain-containing protein [Candidatus Epulonipiscium sp.]
MSLELIKETIEFDRPIRKETVQDIVEGDIIVPDIKPDMVRVLQMNGKVELEQVDILADRINYKGQIRVYVLYAAEGSERVVHNMTGSLPLDNFINMDGIKKEMNYTMEYDLEHLDYTWINSRKISVKALVSMNANVTERKKNEIIIGANSKNPVQIQKQTLTFYNTAGLNQDKMVIKDELAVPSGKPNIQEVLKSDICLSNKEAKVGEDSVTIKGDVNIRTLYAGVMGENEIECIDHKIPYNGTIECPGASEGMHCNTDIKVLNQYIQIRPDLDGEERILEVELVILISIRLISAEKIEVIDDAYCPGKEIKINKQKLPYQRLINKDRESIVLEESLTLDSDAPNIAEIYNIYAKPKIEDIRLMDDKIGLEGIAEIKLIYLTGERENPIYLYETMMPFKQTMDIEGASIDKKVDIRVDVDDIMHTFKSERDIGVKMMFQVDAEIMDEQEIDIIIDMAETEIDPDVLMNMPSLIIYMVQDGDTLWKIAKRYNTTIEELTAINDIEDPEKIYKGQKLLIIKKLSAI